MSNPTGKWTVDTVHRIFRRSWQSSESFQLIADAHNAALAAERKLAHQAEQAATDNADWFDQLCVDLRKLMGMPEEKRPFEVQPILDEVTKLHAGMSQRKSVHQWLTVQNIPEEENGKRICLLRRLRITLDRLFNAQQQLAAEHKMIEQLQREISNPRD